MGDRSEICQACGFTEIDEGDDGFFYCQRCGSQHDGIRSTAIDEHDIIEGTQGYSMRHCRRTPVVIKAEPISQSQPLSQFWESLKDPQEEKEKDVNNLADGIGPTQPTDFGMDSLSDEEYYYSDIRRRYVMGVQIMIELQVKALVDDFNASPLIVGLVESVWFRFLASTRIFDDDWADDIVEETQTEIQGEDDETSYKSRKGEPLNKHGKRCVEIWYLSISKTIPLTYTLAISFLVCHLAREPILATDIVKWALEGKLPYFSAFVDIEKLIGPPSKTCPLSLSRMFRPIQRPSLQKLESLAATISLTIGLELPPVNFYAIALRYLRQLSIPFDNILSHACRIFEWAMPPELWLSANDFRLPTRAFVMSILIVSIRILYDLNGFGKWENSLPAQKEEMRFTCESDEERAEVDAAELLLILEAKYDELSITNDYAKDLTIYLQYCKDVVFCGPEPSFEDREEEMIIDDFWKFYQEKEDVRRMEAHIGGSSGHTNGDQKRSRDHLTRSPKESKKHRGVECASTSSSSLEGSQPNDSQCTMDSKDSSHKGQSSFPPVNISKEERIRRLKSNMEENRFCYMPPRQKAKKISYLQYRRKKDEGAYVYAAHADYYIVLRACARVVEIDVRSLHQAVLHFERRLVWLEKKADHCLKVLPCLDVCEFCSDDTEDVTYDRFSMLNL